MSVAYLKVKIKSLAAEQAIIRHEEHKYLASSRWCAKQTPPAADGPAARHVWAGLQAHSLNLRFEIRAALLAYAYLRGKPYSSVEPTPCWRRAPFCRVGPNWGRIAELVIKYGPARAEWSQAGKDGPARAKAAARKAVHDWGTGSGSSARIAA